MIVTTAPLTAPPFASVMGPTMRPALPWAKRGAEFARTNPNIRKKVAATLLQFLEKRTPSFIGHTLLRSIRSLGEWPNSDPFPDTAPATQNDRHAPRSATPTQTKIRNAQATIV